MIKSSSVRVDIRHTTTAQELARALASIPANATVSVTKTKNHGPREPSESYLTFKWKEIIGD